MQYDENTKILTVSRDEEYVLVKRYDTPTPGWYIQALQRQPEYDDEIMGAYYEHVGLAGWGQRKWLDEILAHITDANGKRVYFSLMDNFEVKDMSDPVVRHVWTQVVPLEWQKDDMPFERVAYLEVWDEPDPRLTAWLDGK